MKQLSVFSALLILLFLSLSLSAQESFFVIHVKGSVTNKTTGKELKVGDKISSEDKVSFGSSDAATVIMGPKGKFTLTPAAKTSNNPGELTAFVKASMLPLKSNGHLSTRGEEPSGVSDLKSYFGTGPFAVIGDKHSVAVNILKYPTNEKQFFVYRYVYEGNVVSKKISSQGNILTIDKNALYTNKGTFIDPEKVKTVEIYYTNTATNNSQKITSFSPLFLNEATLKEELMVQKKVLKEQKKTEDEINKELLNFVLDVYGKADEKIFQNWIKQNLK
jgi:hypothetical protein